LTTLGDTPLLGSLSERRSASATPAYVTNIPPRPAFNSARRNSPRASAHSQLLGLTARRTSPKQPGPGATTERPPTGGRFSFNRPPRFFPEGVALCGSPAENFGELDAPVLDSAALCSPPRRDPLLDQLLVGARVDALLRGLPPAQAVVSRGVVRDDGVADAVALRQFPIGREVRGRSVPVAFVDDLSEHEEPIEFVVRDARRVGLPRSAVLLWRRGDAQIGGVAHRHALLSALFKAWSAASRGRARRWSGLCWL
jgi:hypothetical protein